jgi:nicotinate-nucleotide adenylyltransferase
MRVAFYGGSFNPPHVAHVLAAAYALCIGEFDRVLVVPVYSHAFDKPLAPFEHRARLAEIAMQPLNGVDVSRIEQTLATPSFTQRTLERLAADHPDWSFRLLVGADAVADWQKWHAYDAVAKLAPPFVLGRVGVPSANAPPPVLPGVSSTRVRELLARRGDPDAESELSRGVPRAVLDYIRQHGLYT